MFDCRTFFEMFKYLLQSMLFTSAIIVSSAQYGGSYGGMNLLGGGNDFNFNDNFNDFNGLSSPGSFGGSGFGGGGKQHFGQPGYDHTHDNFDRETTSDELISKRLNPIPHILNPGIRRGVTGLQHIEARYHRKPYPQRELLRPLLLLTNPSKK